MLYSMAPEAHELGSLIGALQITNLGAQEGADSQRRFCRPKERVER